MTEIFADTAVFDGERLLVGRWDVVVDDGQLRSVEPAGSADRFGATVTDASGGTLLPGLIDAHVHLRKVDDLQELGRWGVTTALDMGSWPPELLHELRNAGSTDVRSSGAAAVGGGSPTAGLPGRPADSIVSDADAGRRFVSARAAEGVDYIKVIIDPPGRGGLDQASVSAIVAAAHDRGYLVVAHASNTGAIAVAQTAGVDVLTHAPLNADLDAAAVAEAVRSRCSIVPTLIMMQAVAAAAPIPGLDYSHARSAVTDLHRAGVLVLLGTDANQAPGVPANVPYGESAHRELELLVEAGLAPVEALFAATAGVADLFGMADRGRIAQGLRADLVLVDGDPTRNIAATRSVRAVRSAGRDIG